MATRSMIAIAEEDQRVLSAYCHWDGYPDGVGATLMERHTEPETIRALLEPGDLVSLHDPVQRFSGSHPAQRLTLAATLQRASSMDCEYFYLFAEGGWMVYECSHVLASFGVVGRRADVDEDAEVHWQRPRPLRDVLAAPQTDEEETP